MSQPVEHTALIADPDSTSQKLYWGKSPKFWMVTGLVIVVVLSLGLGIGGGSAILDSLGQTSFALHLQNALRVAGAAKPVPLLDDSLMPLLGGENKAVWFAGVPRANFMKAWFHRMGMDANIKTNRKLVPIEAVDVSAAYRYAAEADLSGLPITEGADPLPWAAP